MAGSVLPGKKQRRISQACDYCHSRAIRCNIASEGEDRRCRNCIDFDQACTYDRIIRRRGVKPSRTSANIARSHAGPSTTNSQGRSSSRVGSSASIARNHVAPSTFDFQSRLSSARWQAPQIATQAVIMDLVEIYFEIVYPIFPLFHRPTFLRKISRAEYTSNPKLFAVTMAVCALVSARARDGAVFNHQWNTEELLQTNSESFYEAALSECHDHYNTDTSDLNVLRTHALLAVISIQYGKPREMQRHLGNYFNMVAMDRLHDEANWPKDIGIVEIEERRRLFWSMYTLDIYSSIVWSGVIRSREQQSNVSYTTELDDESFDDSGYRQHVQPHSPVSIGPSPSGVGDQVRTTSWICGWNFTTDLYRALEHVITMFRDRPLYKRSFLQEICGDRSRLSASSVRDSIMSMYANLPQCFKETEAITCGLSHDRYGFQAANITATVQLLRMVLFSAGGATIEERCQIASEVVNAFMNIPPGYLRAISSPLLNHLAGIGAILGSVFEEPLSESGYQQVRIVLLSLAQLLENLDHGAHSVSSAERLRSQVAKIDEYMATQRVITRSPIQHMAQAAAAAESYDLGPSRQSHGGTGTLPFPLPVDLFDEWPWIMNGMPFPEN